MTVVAFLLRCALATVFLRAGAVKLFDVADFRIAVGNYGLLPERLVRPAALALPLAEVVLGVMLLVGLDTGPVAALLLALLAGFSAAIAFNLRRGRTFSCGCSGKTSSDISWRHVSANAVLAAMAAVVSLWAFQPLAVVAGWGFRDGTTLGPGQAGGRVAYGRRRRRAGPALP